MLLGRVSWAESPGAKLTRGGRAKKVTKKMKEARERGWVPESQHGK